jgi:hypothetical protein
VPQVPSIITPGDYKTIALCNNTGQNFTSATLQLHEWSKLDVPETTDSVTFKRPRDSGTEIKAGDGLPNYGDLVITTYLEATTPAAARALIPATRATANTIVKIIERDVNGNELNLNVSAFLGIKPVRDGSTNTIYKVELKYRTSSFDWY